MRSLMGLLSGVVVAVLTVLLVERIGHLVAPSPAGFDHLRPDELPAAIAALPFATKLAVPLAWFAGALAGASLATGIARRTWPGWVVVAFILVGTMLTVATISHPLWMVVTGIAAPIVGGWLATRLVRPRSAPTSTI